MNVFYNEVLVPVRILHECRSHRLFVFDFLNEVEVVACHFVKESLSSDCRSPPVGSSWTRPAPLLALRLLLTTPEEEEVGEWKQKHYPLFCHFATTVNVSQSALAAKRVKPQ